MVKAERGIQRKMELEKILKMLEEREFKELKEELSGMYPVDIAAL